MPIIRPIHRGLKQVFRTLFSKSASTFRTVGLVEFPAPGMWSLVFLSSPPGSHITAHLPSPEEHVSVFMPCTPNPTTGFFFYVPRREVIELNIPVEEAAKLIMTAGMIQPGGDAQESLAALAQTARTVQVARASEQPGLLPFPEKIAEPRTMDAGGEDRAAATGSKPHAALAARDQPARSSRIASSRPNK